MAVHGVPYDKLLCIEAVVICYTIFWAHGKEQYECKRRDVYVSLQSKSYHELLRIPKVALFRDILWHIATASLGTRRGALSFLLRLLRTNE